MNEFQFMSKSDSADWITQKYYIMIWRESEMQCSVFYKEAPPRPISSSVGFFSACLFFIIAASFFYFHFRFISRIVYVSKIRWHTKWIFCSDERVMFVTDFKLNGKFSFRLNLQEHQTPDHCFQICFCCCYCCKNINPRFFFSLCQIQFICQFFFQTYFTFLPVCKK